MGLIYDQIGGCDLEAVLEAAGGRLREIYACLEAIDMAELLSELPENPAARPRHRIGMCLLSIVVREVAVLITELDDAATLGAATDGSLPH